MIDDEPQRKLLQSHSPAEAECQLTIWKDRFYVVLSIALSEAIILGITLYTLTP